MARGWRFLARSKGQKASSLMGFTGLPNRNSEAPVSTGNAHIGVREHLRNHDFGVVWALKDRGALIAIMVEFEIPRATQRRCDEMTERVYLD